MCNVHTYTNTYVHYTNVGRERRRSCPKQVCDIRPHIMPGKRSLRQNTHSGLI